MEGESATCPHRSICTETTVLLSKELYYPDSVGVIGSGYFGSALVSIFSKAGIPLQVGSRTPGKPCGGIVTCSLEDTFKNSSIILLALPFRFVRDLPWNMSPKGQIVVDCTNRYSTCRGNQKSQAEELKNLLPEWINIVKGFNTLSAHETKQNKKSIQEIPLASDDKGALQAVGKLVTRVGYSPVDYGLLRAAREIENIPLSLFPEWHIPCLISLILWIFFYLLQFGRSYLCKNNTYGWYALAKDSLGNEYPNLINMLLRDVIKACDGQSLNLLAACYLPGVLVSYLQLLRGTKYTSIPAWLDSWMLMRKKLGLLMLFSASLHGLYCCLLFNNKEGSNNSWDRKAYLCAGVLGYALAVILGIASLPSVSSSLSWREFRAVQSVLGWTCLFISSLHCTFRGLRLSKDGLNYRLFSWEDCNFLTAEQAGLILPLITFVLKLPLLLPWVDYRLTKIRQGEVFAPTSGWMGLRAFGHDIHIF